MTRRAQALGTQLRYAFLGKHSHAVISRQALEAWTGLYTPEGKLDADVLEAANLFVLIGAEHCVIGTPRGIADYWAERLAAHFTASPGQPVMAAWHNGPLHLCTPYSNHEYPETCGLYVIARLRLMHWRAVAQDFSPGTSNVHLRVKPPVLYFDGFTSMMPPNRRFIPGAPFGRFMPLVWRGV